MLLAASAMLVAGCAARRPDAAIGRADLAFDHALKSKAPEYASAELRTAQAKLTQARDATAEGDQDDARRLAEEALAQAQLAEAKADSRAAQAQAQNEIEELREEARRLGATTTVTEATIVREARPRVVVLP